MHSYRHNKKNSLPILTFFVWLMMATSPSKAPAEFALNQTHPNIPTIVRSHCTMNYHVKIDLLNCKDQTANGVATFSCSQGVAKKQARINIEINGPMPSTRYEERGQIDIVGDHLNLDTFIQILLDSEISRPEDLHLKKTMHYDLYKGNSPQWKWENKLVSPGSHIGEIYVKVFEGEEKWQKPIVSDSIDYKENVPSPAIGFGTWLGFSDWTFVRPADGFKIFAREANSTSPDCLSHIKDHYFRSKTNLMVLPIPTKCSELSGNSTTVPVVEGCSPQY